MKWPVLLGITFLIFQAGLAGAPPSTLTQAQATAAYEVRGVLVSSDAQARQATIAHEKIPGYMAAMTMSFDVADPAELHGLHPGDALAFRLCVDDDSAWIDHIRKAGPATALPLVPAPPRSAKEFAIGDVVPDIALLDQSDTALRLSDFRGKVLALTFIYTSCPLPTYCPRLNRNFQNTRDLLERLMPAGGWHFLSVSFDAPHDTAKVLTAYAGMYGAKRESWTFASADERSVHVIGDGIGLEFKRTETRIDHNLRTVVIDASGRLRQVFRGNNWTPQELASAMHAATRPIP